MTYKQANEILDERRAGADVSERQILKALELTGDYNCDFNPELTAALHELEAA
jgi:hypothetical protein